MKLSEPSKEVIEKTVRDNSFGIKVSYGAELVYALDLGFSVLAT